MICSKVRPFAVAVNRISALWKSPVKSVPYPGKTPPGPGKPGRLPGASLQIRHWLAAWQAAVQSRPVLCLELSQTAQCHGLVALEAQRLAVSRSNVIPIKRQAVNRCDLSMRQRPSRFPFRRANSLTRPDLPASHLTPSHLPPLICHPPAWRRMPQHNSNRARIRCVSVHANPPPSATHVNRPDQDTMSPHCWCNLSRRWRSINSGN